MRVLNLALFALVSLHPVAAQDSDNCTASYKNQFNEPNFDAAFASLSSSALTNALIDGTVPDVSTARNFTLGTGNTFQILEERCNELVNHTLCSVSSVVSNGGFTTIEEGKSVCIPDSCSLESIDMIDPSICGDKEGCSIVSREVVCPGDRQELSGDCNADISALIDNRSIQNQEQRLEARFDEACVDLIFGTNTRRCDIIDVTSGNALTSYNAIKDYSKFDTLEARALETHCNLLDGFSMCAMTTTATKGDMQFHEVDKPVCVPLSCKGDNLVDVTDLDFAPLCDDDLCEITSRVITCPDPPVGVKGDEPNEQDCEDDVGTIEDDDVYVNLYESFIISMDTECMKALNGNGGDSCAVLPMMSLTIDATSVDSDLRDAVVQSCVASGNTACLFTGTTVSTARDSTKNEMETWSFSEFPVCMPADCADEQILDLSLPSFESSSRTINIEEFTCGITMAPTKSPTKSPTTSPTVTESAPPTIVASSLPTIVASSLPTVVQSEQPSVMKSSEPTQAQSSSPTVPEAPVEEPEEEPVTEEPVTEEPVTAEPEPEEPVTEEPEIEEPEIEEPETEEPTTEEPSDIDETSSVSMKMTGQISTAFAVLVGFWAILQ